MYRVSLAVQCWARRIKVCTATPRSPFSGRFIEDLGGDGCVLQWPPCASRTVIHSSRNKCEIFPKLLGCLQSAARRKQFTQVFREPFVYPEQFAFHGLLIISRSKAGRTTILAVPGVNKLVRQQAGN